MALSGSSLGIYLFIILFGTKSMACEQSFIVSFQSKSNGAASPSDNEWVEFVNEMPSSNAFTACLWIKTRFFNTNTAVNLWSYCTIAKNEDKMECLQVFLKGDPTTANRNVIINGYIPNKPTYDKFKVKLHSFLHRTWIHFCWSFSSASGRNKFYYNGNLLGNSIINISDKRNVLHNSTEMFASALLFGQEPDSIRGSFNKFQAFIGDLTGLNIWNYTVNDANIKNIAECKSWEKGNIVAWEKNTIRTYNVIIKPLVDPTSLCFEDQRFVIFPQKVLYPEAQEQCAIHGGKLVVPRSEEENSKVLKIVNKHKKQCNKPMAKTSEKPAVWIGAKKVNSKWYEARSDGTTGNLLNYTKWTYQEVKAGKDCAILLNDGLWKEGASNECRSSELCTVCSFTHTPVLTLKGACFHSDIDWNYYIKIGNKNEVVSYEGYKLTNIFLNNKLHRWEILTKGGIPQNFVAHLYLNATSNKYPVG